MHANTTLHFDISSGIAGDMSLAVLHGLGLDLKEVTDIVYKMTEKQIKIDVEEVFINGIKSARLKIVMPHEHAHRKLKDIRELISKAELPEQAAKDAVGIFEIIADAEGQIHGKSSEDVHFHEVGALDSILDIVGFAYGINKLGIDKVTATAPVLGSGFVKCAHGKVPVPAPATLKILEGVDVIRTNEPNELTTPTGAAILKYYVKQFSTAYTGKILGSAYSTGTLTLETIPNILRGTLIASAEKREQITVLETNIDDCSGEVMGTLFSTLEPVALDFFITAITGKKNRPAMHLTILCENESRDNVAEILFRNTSTAGVRYHTADRLVMDRHMESVEVSGEIINVKVLTMGDIKKYSPEWDDCVRAGNKLGCAPAIVYDTAKANILK